MLRPSLDPSQLRPGDALPEQAHTFTEVDLVAYAAATWDWHRLHYDKAHAHSKHLPGVLIDGQAFGAVFAREAMRWAGPQAFIQRMALKMKSMAFAGDHLVARGQVKAIDAPAGHWVVHIEQQLMCGERLVAQAISEIRMGKA
jgi:acyl dehydratase